MYIQWQCKRQMLTNSQIIKYYNQISINITFDFLQLFFIWRYIIRSKMRFEAQVRRDKLKTCQSILLMCIAIIKSRPLKFSVYFIYVAGQNEVRILIQSQIAPMIIVLVSEMFTKIESQSKNQKTNSSLGFQFKNGLSFLQNFLYFLKQDSLNTIQQQKTFLLKLSKDKQYRSLQIKSKNKLYREEIEKPTKNQEELFTYQWIDGVRKSRLTFEVPIGGIIQILKVVAKAKNHYIFHAGVQAQRKLFLRIDFQSSKLNLSIKSQQPALQIQTKIMKFEGDGKYFEYQIKNDDAQVLLLCIKNECMFVIDEQRNISATYFGQVYNCQISLKTFVNFVSENINPHGIKSQM